MIYYFSAAKVSKPMHRYLQHWGRPLLDRIHLLAYDDVVDPDALADGTFIFGDVEKLPREKPATARAARTLWKALKVRGEAVQLLNHPGRSLHRYELLRTLYELGWNRFNVYRLNEPRTALRYPVFVRNAYGHMGSYTPLLGNAPELESAIAGLADAGYDEDNLLIVEYLDTADRGLYRKYAAVCIDGRIIPNHIMFGREWQVKGPSLVDPAMVAEERIYQKRNPHERRLQDVFRLARIDYGRVDYALVNGQLQVWEINSNPNVLYPPKRYEQSQMPNKVWFSKQYNQAFRELDYKTSRRHSLRHLLRRLTGSNEDRHPRKWTINASFLSS